MLRGKVLMTAGLPGKLLDTIHLLLSATLFSCCCFCSQVLYSGRLGVVCAETSELIVTKEPVTVCLVYVVISIFAISSTCFMLTVYSCALSGKLEE